MKIKYYNKEEKEIKDLLELELFLHDIFNKKVSTKLIFDFKMDNGEYGYIDLEFEDIDNINRDVDNNGNYLNKLDLLNIKKGYPKSEIVFDSLNKDIHNISYRNVSDLLDILEFYIFIEE